MGKACVNQLPAEPRNEPNIVAVIQARMGSTRLPGKVLRPIAGRPLLWHVVHRLRRSRLIGQIAIATSVNPRDDAIVEFAREQGLIVVRGSEDDVLARFARAADMLEADVIVRVNADAPFIDAGFVDHLITAMLAENADYVLLEDGAVTAHCGVDPMSRRALDKLMMDARDDAIAREHVTGYFKLHPDFVRIARAAPYPALARDGTRLTIDTPDDLAFAEIVHERLAAKAGEAVLADLLLLLEREPDLRAVNAHVRQKPVDAGGLCLIRCDGGGPYGYGHVKRMVMLARALRDHQGIGVVFALNGSDDALLPIRSAGFEGTQISGDDEVALAGLIAQHRPDILVCDFRDGVAAAGLDRLKQHVALCGVIDDASERRRVADLAYFPPLPRAQALDWNNSCTLVRMGWQWTILGARPATRPAPDRLGLPRLLVTMGGSDPKGLTLRCAQALAREDVLFRARFVIGRGVADGARLAKAIVGLSPQFETIEGADDLGPEFAGADAALCAFGVTAYELAASGVPALYLGLTEDHVDSAAAFAAAGMGLNLGLADTVSDETIVVAVRRLLGDATLRRQMRHAGLSRMDADGAERIAADLTGHLAQRRAQTRLRAG
jgi:spore coat polysaccharide biosynthesis protein SpsF